jgi:REP element-mobilizing transposase RayT
VLYHVIARGNHRQPTYLTDLDYRAYLTRLAAYRKRYAMCLYAYCLMPNHVHLLVQTSEPPLNKFMQGLQQSYTQWFNRVHGKVGHLFQGRYRAIVCDRDEYLVTPVRYIHLNLVRAQLVERPEAYPYSGHRAYLTGDGKGLIDPGPVLRMLGGAAAYRRFVLGGIEAGHEDRYYPIAAQPFLGAPAFAERIEQRAARPPAPGPRPPLAVAFDELASRLAVDPAALRRPDRSEPVSRARAAVSYVLVRRLGYRLTDVAAALGRDPATLSTIVSRVARRLESSGPVAADVTRLSREV